MEGSQRLIKSAGSRTIRDDLRARQNCRQYFTGG
jgi:hypothetical protein